MPATLTFENGVVRLSGGPEDGDDFKLAVAIQLALSSPNYVNLTFEFASIFASYKPSLIDIASNTQQELTDQLNRLKESLDSSGALTDQLKEKP